MACGCSTKKVGTKTVRWSPDGSGAGGCVLVRCVMDDRAYSLIAGKLYEVRGFNDIVRLPNKAGIPVRAVHAVC